MPVIGIVDPTHRERKKDYPGRPPKWVTVQEALADALISGPKWSPWNYELMNAAISSHQERGSRLSVTAISGGCMRGTILERKEDYITDLDRMYPSLRGVMFHKGMEEFARPGSIAEWRFYTDVDGTEISGSPDLITYDTIWDWKTTENPPSYGYMWDSHNLQLQYNRFCFNNATKWDAPDGVDPKSIPFDPHFAKIQHLAIVYIGPKGPKVIETQVAKQVQNRTNAGTRTQKVPDVWDDSDVLDSLRPRIEAWNLAWNSYPAWPAGLENYPGWAGPADWRCPGPPLCHLPNCLAKRYPDNLTWTNT